MVRYFDLAIPPAPPRTPLLQSTVKRELIAFEEAVRRVEAEIARRAHSSK
jgi:hypothetical protein